MLKSRPYSLFPFHSEVQLVTYEFVYTSWLGKINFCATLLQRKERCTTPPVTIKNYAAAVHRNIAPPDASI